MQKDLNFIPAKQWAFDDVLYQDIDLSVARVKPEEIGLGGQRIFIATKAYDSEYVESTTKSVGTALATLNEKNGRPIELNAGMYYDFNGAFDAIWIRNTAQANKMLRVYTSANSIIRPFSSEIEVIGNTGIDTQIDEADNDIATAATLAFAANLDLKERIIVNDSPYDIMFLGSDNAGTNGPIIPALGGHLAVKATNAVYLMAIGGTAAKELVNSINITG